MPEHTAEELKKALTLADAYVLEKLISYLTLDSYEIVKNLAKITDSSNASQVIAYRDGALSRNEALAKTLRECLSKTHYNDRIEGTTKQAVAKKKS